MNNKILNKELAGLEKQRAKYLNQYATKKELSLKTGNDKMCFIEDMNELINYIIS